MIRNFKLKAIFKKNIVFLIVYENFILKLEVG
jgi:hypothetical protein